MKSNSKFFFLKSFLAITVLIFFLVSCAQVVMPGGGKKDTTPPKVVKYIPDSAQLNFNSKTIEITFNEFVQLKDLNSQLIVSPPLKKNPDINIKGKTLNIVFDKNDTLRPNTTYSISFGNALQDITENNPLENFKYIFSTGNFIDSSYVKGKVETGFNHTVEKGILVMLYSNFNDSVVFKHLPDYFAKTKDDGSFQIHNIKEGKYKMIVLKDGNNNYKYDESENIGFIDTPIDVSKKEVVMIDLFQERAKKLFLKKNMYDSYGKIIFVFNKNADSIAVTPINHTFGDNDVLLQYSKNKDSLTYWFRNIDNDVLKLQLKDGSRVMDTLEYKLIKKEDALKSRKNKLALNLVNNFGGNQNYDLNEGLELVFNQPIETVNKNINVTLKQDSVLIKNSKNLTFYQEGINQFIFISSVKCDSSKKGNNSSTVPCTYKTVIPSKADTKYQLFIPPGTFTDFFGLTNDTIKMDFKTRDGKYYGTLKLKVNIPESEGQYIVQLMDDKENLYHESIIKAGETINYEFLHPQQYKLKMIYDENKNGKWDTGNYLKKIQPEKVIYYTGAITVRSNWDLDLEWKITDK